MREWNAEYNVTRVLSDSSFAGRTSDLNTGSADVVVRANAPNVIDAGDIRTWHYAIARDAEPSQAGVDIPPSEPSSATDVDSAGGWRNPAFDVQAIPRDDEAKVKKWMQKARELGFAIR